MAGARVKVLTGPRGGRFPEAVSILVESPSTRLLIDAGSSQAVEAAGRVDAVLYTHHHPDHIRVAHAVRAARQYSPAGEAAYRGMRDLARRFAPPIWRLWLEMAQTFIGALTVPRGDYFEPGEDVCIRDLCIKTAPAPGHLATHTLIEAPGGILHIADLDLTPFGPWYGNPESDPLRFLADAELAASWGARAYATSHLGRILPRHEAIPALARFVARLADHLEAVLQAYARLGRPGRPADIAGGGVIYPRIPERGSLVYVWFEEAMIEKATSLLSASGCLRATSLGFEPKRSGYCRVVERIRERATGLLSYL
jgi:glyoxylase-like metal-dependent hydrolase (beta-lactamase superfamily II)